MGIDSQALLDADAAAAEAMAACMKAQMAAMDGESAAKALYAEWAAEQSADWTDAQKAAMRAALG